ncbi:hypothetical protein B0H19DRAFT_1248904 [Mycena capillaripes]|nr:hypothetical protein B0H19DRAFT_1248904 [Mycena capillaripes]
MAPIDFGTSVYAGSASHESVPSPVPSVVYDTDAPSDTGLHQFTMYMIVIGVAFLLSSAYVIGKNYIRKWRAENVLDEKFIPIGAAFTLPTIDALPARSATFGRSDYWVPHYQQRPAYISQADMPSGRGFFG